MLDTLPEPALKMYAAIGHLTVRWSSAEFILDSIILAVHDRFDGNKVQPGPPISYNKKPGYLRKAFRQHDALSPHLDSLNSLLDEANQIAEFRKWCAHGVIGLEPEEDGKFELVKLVREPDAAIATKKYSADKIEFVAARTLALSANLYFFGAFELGIFPSDIPGGLLDRARRQD